MQSAEKSSENATLDQEELPSRFEVELEFVQALANIPYVTHLLTQHQLWQDPKFKEYLKYLEYWCESPYVQYIVYPNSLFVLKLLNGFLEKAETNEDGILEGAEELPKILQMHGGQLMNDMVERWKA
ncbi:HCL334Wp [Eremothecium sinecaudum]|uniref:Mediator of RNA polymerase II transcription subunit 31 n=1 Tax=Eremothecium sinecaudum TaxID=45286 RepID=A0A120K1X1_9SACH|nr:HCL334Wp [Eremothecium sinecaudum]AMD19817.1 HCL334Wp [Eremothecium sinecaudum]